MFDIRATRWTQFAAKTALGLAALGLSLGSAACGGGGGSGTGDTLKGVVLVDFLQSGQDNVPLNRTLEFRFSSPIDPNSVNPDSIQIRQGSLFGSQVFGKFIVQSSTIFFEPQIAGLCDLSDSGFKANTDYRVTIVGSPEEFALRSLAGDPLKATVSALFHTRPETDPELFEDQVPGAFPTVIATSPVNGAYPQSSDPTISGPVQVFQGNKITIDFSENLSPCTVNQTTVLFYQYAHGDPVNGFVPNADQTPSSPTSWGSGTADTPPRRVRANFVLKQDQLTTQLTLTPVFNEFPDNALLVVQVTNNIKDFGGNALVPLTFSFVTQNRPLQVLAHTFRFNGAPNDFPVDADRSTGDVNTPRALGKVQGFLLYAGDKDNGASKVRSSGPDTSNGPGGCSVSYVQANDGVQDDFDPSVDQTLDTGATTNTCKNSTDGSTAVVFEYRTFRIRNGVTVRLIGVNPAIILVSGDVTIEPTGRLLARGDGGGASPFTTNGSKGTGWSAATVAGGVSCCGGGAGGYANNASTTFSPPYSANGTAGFGSPDAFLSPGFGGTDPTRAGAGRGAVAVNMANYPTNRISPGGGGAGHAVAGFTGEQNGSAGANAAWANAFADGVGGSTYGDSFSRMKTPESGSGGGGGGTNVHTSFSGWNSPGGGGGGGGGFVDITSSGNITILGTIDAAGGKGGDGSNGNNSPNAFAYYGAGGGGGGGSGGGIRILTANQMTLGATTILTTAAGAGGTSGANPQYGAPANMGGAGSVGRIALEDGDGQIFDIARATLTPLDSFPAAQGFYKGPFDGTRFTGNTRSPVVVTTLIDIGPLSPTYVPPDQNYVGSPVAAPGTPRLDFIAGIPQVASRGLGKTGILIEMQGFGANSDGTPDSIGTGWKAVGYFTDSGAESFPIWNLGLPPLVDVTPPVDNAGAGIAALNGKQFVQVRVTFYLKTGMGPFDQGPYIDNWDLWFTYDQ